MAEMQPAAGGDTAVRRFALISPAIWAAVLGGLAALSLVAMLPLSLLARQFGDGIVAVVIGIPCAGVGVLVARRQPGNPLGWIFLVIAVCLFLATDGGDYAFLVYRRGDHLPLGSAGLACDRLWGADAEVAGRGGGLDAGRGGIVRPRAAAGAAGGGPPVQPGQVRRRPHRGGVRGPAQGRRRPGGRPGRPGRGDQDTLEPAHVSVWLSERSAVSPAIPS
jgi:hypothetical protein